MKKELSNKVFEYYHSIGVYDRIIFKEKINNKIEELEILKKEIENKGYIYNKQKENLVFSDGNLNSKIMLIGEAPGFNEEKLNKPFVGEAGQLLDKMLAAINILRDQVYITNVVNFRPPDNRKPNIQEIQLFRPLIEKHIEIIDPKVILLLGSTALESFFDKKYSITKIRGSWLQIKIKNKVYETIPTFHPAFLLRQADQKKFSWEDLKEFKKYIDNNNILNAKIN